MIEQLKARLGHDEHCRYFEAANNDRYCTCTRREILEWANTQAVVIEEVRDLIDNSAGVDGLHLNGDLAPWDWLIGNEWLEATGKALGDTND